MAHEPQTILFMPESAYGPTNNCIGIGDVLRRGGHRVVFAAERSWAGKLEALGFVEDLVDLAPPPPTGRARAGSVGQFWKDFIRDTAPEFRKPTIEQLATFMQPTWQALIDGAIYCEPQLREIIDRQRPDVIVEDNVVAFPALVSAGVPFVRIVSCNPLEVRGPDIPPPYSGLPSDDRSEWEAFRAEYERTHRPMWEAFDALGPRAGSPGTALTWSSSTPRTSSTSTSTPRSSTTRIAGRSTGRGSGSIRASARPTPTPNCRPSSQIGPTAVPSSTSRSGRSASADVGLMRRLVDVLSRTPHRYIVSKGPQHAEYELADNMWGAEFLPQTKLIPLVDLVITHGGNNTTTEAFHFGKPMIVLPLFWDQYDNAQRVDETGFGVRLRTYDFTDDELHRAIDGPACESGPRPPRGSLPRDPRPRRRRPSRRRDCRRRERRRGNVATMTATAAEPRLRTVRATRYVTAFREGGSLPGLVEADDDGLYVVKFRGAGQGPRALVAEWLAGEIGRVLGLLVPDLVEVDLRRGDRGLGAPRGDPRPARRERRAEHRAGLPAGVAHVQPRRGSRGESGLGRRCRLVRRVRHQPGPLCQEPEHARLARADRGSSTTGRRSTSITPGATPRSMRAGRSTESATTSCCRPQGPSRPPTSALRPSSPATFSSA